MIFKKAVVLCLSFKKKNLGTIFQEDAENCQKVHIQIKLNSLTHVIQS